MSIERNIAKNWRMQKTRYQLLLPKAPVVEKKEIQRYSYESGKLEKINPDEGQSVTKTGEKIQNGNVIPFPPIPELAAAGD